MALEIPGVKAVLLLKRWNNSIKGTLLPEVNNSLTAMGFPAQNREIIVANKLPSRLEPETIVFKLDSTLTPIPKFPGR